MGIEIDVPSDFDAYYGDDFNGHERDAALLLAAPDMLLVLRDVRDNGLIYWEPNTERGRVAKAQMIARINAVIAAAGEQP